MRKTFPSSNLVSYREGLAAGASRRELAGSSYRRVHHDLYLGAEHSPEHPDVRIQIAARIAGDQGHVGGWAAARIHETRALRRGHPSGVRGYFDGLAPWPGGTGELEPVLLCMSRTAKVRQSPHIETLRSDLEPEDLMEIDGISLTSPLRTAFDLARRRAPWHAVTAVDRLAHLGIVDLTELGHYADSLSRKHGARRALTVIRQADARAESPPESLTRMVWHDARLPRPTVNAEVRTADGEFVARVDLLDPRSRLVVEYDGSHHASAEQRARDSRREEALEELGYVVVKVTSTDLASPGSRWRLRARLIRAYRRALMTVTP